jgi:hypothetical protein
MQVIKTTNTDLLDRIFSDEKLCAIAFADGKKPEYFKDTNNNYLVAFHNEVPIAALRFQEFTDITANCHIYVKSEYWHNKISYKLIPAFENWFLENTQYHKVVAMSPESSKHVHFTLAKNGFWLEGVLTGAICWQGKVEGLLVFSKFLKRSA